ncbi:MAG TPA: site-specific integrase [Trebonia sp.]
MTTAGTSAAASQQANVDAALLVLKSMGLSLDDLLSASSNRKPVPTFAEYIPVVAATLTGSTLRAYSSYWKRTVEQWGGRRLDEPTPSEVKQLAVHVKANAVQRRNGRGGHNAAENLISALRCLYNHAVDDGLIAEKDNPARKVDKPRRLPSTRRALDGAQLAEINHVAATTGNDPELDALIVRLHTETACRRGGALALRPRDLDREQCVVLLREKGETFRWQPVSPTLMAALVKHAEDRNAPSDGGLLRYRDGRQITDRRYDQLWVRIGRELPWFRNQGVSTHWIRHTTLTWVERNFGFAVAHAYAGHTDGRDDRVSVTTTYVRATLAEVATALAALTGEPHPLALSGGGRYDSAG